MEYNDKGVFSITTTDNTSRTMNDINIYNPKLTDWPLPPFNIAKSKPIKDLINKTNTISNLLIELATYGINYLDYVSICLINTAFHSLPKHSKSPVADMDVSTVAENIYMLLPRDKDTDTILVDLSKSYIQTRELIGTFVFNNKYIYVMEGFDFIELIDWIIECDVVVPLHIKINV